VENKGSFEIIQAFFTTKLISKTSSCLVTDEAGERLEKLNISELENINREIEKVYSQYGNSLLPQNHILRGNQFAMDRLLSSYVIWIAKNGIELKDIPKITKWSPELINYFMRAGKSIYKTHRQKA
jgi:hypothetical protein